MSSTAHRRRIALAGAGALVTALALAAVGVSQVADPSRAEEPPALATPTPPPATPRKPVAEPAVFGTWAPTFRADQQTYTEEEAVALARRFDMVAALPNTFVDHVDAMRAANPELVLLSYTNGMLTPPVLLERLPHGWYTLDDEGRYIRSRQFGQYLMDPGQAEWRAYSTSQCVEKVQRSGYDGCLVDMLTMGVFAPRYLTSRPAGVDADPAEVQTRYQEGLVRLADEFADLEGVAIAGNTVTSPGRYFADTAGTREVAARLPMNQAEDFLRSAGDPADAFPSEFAWRTEVAVLQDLTALGSRALVTTKLWVPADDEISRQWQRLSIGSFLLGAGEGSFHAFTSSRTREGAISSGDDYRLPKDIGRPTSEMVAWQGLYGRTFSGGLALVNPTPFPLTVDLPAPLTSWDGEVVQRLVVPPDDATVLFGTEPSLPSHAEVPVPPRGSTVPASPETQEGPS